MIGYLIYDEEEAAKNQAFIRMFQEEGQKEGITFSYVSKEQYRKEPLPQLVLNRTRDADVSVWYEERKIPVLHESFLTRIGNHKFFTLQYLKKHLTEQTLKTAWAPRSFLIPPERIREWACAVQDRDVTQLQEINDFWKRDGVCVLKTVDGHGGSEVTELCSPKRAEAFCGDAFWKELSKTLQLFYGRECILQEKISSDSKDVRVYILGNRIYQCMLRQGTKDFRSNFSLGGYAEPYRLLPKEQEVVETVLKAFEGHTLGLVGLDFIIDREGKLIFNELEEMVGCRMLYQYTGHNVVRDYVHWLRKEFLCER